MPFFRIAHVNDPILASIKVISQIGLSPVVIVISHFQFLPQDHPSRYLLRRLSHVLHWQKHFYEPPEQDFSEGIAVCVELHLFANHDKWQCA